MKIPEKFESILRTSNGYHSIVLDVVTSFEGILNDNKLYFFEEYTDHGIKHIEKVLKAAEFIITDESFENIEPIDVTVLVLAIILHDIGMHMELSTFNKLLKGDYDNCLNKSIDYKTWAQLWDEYLGEVKRFSTIQKKNIFGNEKMAFKIPDLSNKDALDGFDKKLIGEFVRRHHGRFAFEIAIEGLKGEKGTISFGTDKLDLKYKQLSGILARSHSMNIRDTFDYLKFLGSESWRNPHNVNIIYLMVIIRIADYIQIDNTRLEPYLLKLKTFTSPISQLEHQTHLSIDSLNFKNLDDEMIYVLCTPRNSEMFIKIKNLISDIQNEFDKSWAILGEVYGFMPKNKPAIKFRRISSQLEDKEYLHNLKYISEKVTFRVDNNLSKLLVGPLYGDKPTFGVRELLQNAIDACLERKQIEDQIGNYDYEPIIKVSLNRIKDNESEFTIVDNGKGMTKEEIINYFLNVGSSFRKSMDWKKKFVDEQGKSKINRNGKFGIGVLASFLLGDEITVQTKSIDNNETYLFYTTIDSQFINLSKEDSVSEYGTTIKVNVDNDRRNRLLNKKNNYDDKSLNWVRWYIYDIPTIVFKLDGSVLPSVKHYDVNNFFQFDCENFEKVNWLYTTKKTEYGGIVNNNMISCNGIIITEDFQPSVFRYEDDNIFNHDGIYQATSHKHVIYKKPSILVTDKEGVFPVKLDRNSIDCYDLPFEDKLLGEVSKHYIALMLTLKVDNKKYEKVDIGHSAKMLFCNNGYTFNFDYFIDGLKNDFNFIRLITENSFLEIDILKYQNCILNIDFNEKINLSNQERNVTAGYELSARILLPKSNFISLFESSTKRLNRYIIDNCELVEKREDYVLYNMNDYDKDPIILKSIEVIDKSLLEKVISIQEIDSKYFTLKGGEILNGLLAKYIKHNYIIPYDIEERKKLYKEAFQDLKEFMR